MKVLFVFYVPSGGVETLNRQRRQALSLAGITAHFLYYRKERELVNDHEAPTFITNDDQEIAALLREHQYDAMIVTSDFLSFPRFRRLGFTGKMILEIQGYGPKEVARVQLANAVPTVTNYGDAVLNPKTPHISQIFSTYYDGFPKFEFNNCFDAEAFSYQPGHGQPKLIIGWVGRIEDNKNWREFLHVAHKVITELRNDIELYMFEDPSLADPAERKEFEKLLDGLNLHSYLTLLQDIPNEQMQAYYSKIGDSGGFLCMTSKVEGAPLTVMEALSCKCPVLTTDSDGVRSAILHDQSGKYYEMGNMDNALQQAKELIENQEKRWYIRENGLLHVKDQFSHKKYAQHFKEMLLTLGVK